MIQLKLEINNNIEGLFITNEIKLFVILFPDDDILCAHTPEALQSILNDLQLCFNWGMYINTT
jgi:hypothetical protein